MTLFLAWSPGFDDAVVEDLVGEVTGPWREVRPAGELALLVDSDATLSQVYHALKWAMPGSPALLVTACESTPKAKGLPPGTVSWMRSRTDPRSGQ